MPIPSVAPATVGAAPASVPMAPRSYRYQSVPSASAGRGVPAARNRGLVTVVTTLVILIVCFLIGSGIYYFINRTGTTPTLNAIDVSVQSTTETGATITWKTDKPASSQVIVRDSSGAIITETELQETLDTGHSVVVSSLKPNTTYSYTLISRDAAGAETKSEGKLTTTTAATTDKTAPTISGVNVSNITESGAVITWITDEPATSQVKYEKTEKTSSTTPVNTDLTTTHNVTLTKLDSGTTYNFSIISKDAAGNEAAAAANQTFKTLTPIPVGSQVGNRAPDFALKDLDGKDVKLSDFQGKIVMINFWAVWCGPCKDELPFIQAISDSWSGKGVQVLAIAVKENEQLDTVQQYITQNSYTFQVLFDSQGINSVYNATYLPTTFFIDKEGIIKKIQVGSFQYQSGIESILNSL
jgi:thiol-disulfide isomerase/thioredoxin